MKAMIHSPALFLCLVGTASAVSERGTTQVTPVQKVLQLMDDMLEKGQKEKDAEAVQFATYQQFCQDTSVEKKQAIEKGEELIAKHQADIADFSEQANHLQQKISKLESDIAKWEGDEKAATKVRHIEKVDYGVKHKDLTDTVDALKYGIEMEKRKFQSQGQASSSASAAFVQLSAERREAAEAKLATVMAGEPGAETGEAEAFVSHGAEIIETMEKMLDKVSKDRVQAEKDEKNSHHQYDMLMNDLKMELADAKDDLSQKQQFKSEKMQERADAESDLADASSTRDEDETYLNDLTATCTQKAADFKSRQQLRQEELEAIEKAKEIIGSSAVKGSADKHMPAMLQKGASFAQIAAGEQGQQLTAAQYLFKQSKKLNSNVLLTMVTHLQRDPLYKVKKMMKDLVMKLVEEANEEAEHKGWCDTELATNKQTREQKTEAVDMLHAEIDQLESSIAKLAEDLKTLTAQVAELDQAIAKSTEIRMAEKAKNAQTIKDAQAAQEAVTNALIVLKEFYAKAAEATALAQQPEIFDSEYKGMGGDSGGVIGMLEVIENDFARLEADTTAGEETSQREYDTFMTDSKTDKAGKSRDVDHKMKKQGSQTVALQQKKDDLKDTQKQLDAALAYFEKLKPDCVGAGESFADKVQKRKEEIESLQESLRILNGEDIM